MTSDVTLPSRLYRDLSTLVARLEAVLDQLERDGLFEVRGDDALTNGDLARYRELRADLTAHFARESTGAEDGPEPSASCAPNSAQPAPARRGTLNLGPPSA